MEEMGLAELPDEFLSLISPIDIRKISGRIVSLSDVLDCVSFVEEGIDSSVSSSSQTNPPSQSSPPPYLTSYDALADMENCCGYPAEPHLIPDVSVGPVYAVVTKSIWTLLSARAHWISRALSSRAEVSSSSYPSLTIAQEAAVKPLNDFIANNVQASPNQVLSW